MKKEQLKSIIKEIVSVVLENEDKMTATNAVQPKEHFINGQSNNVAANRVNKLLAALSKGFFSDENWEAIHKIFSKLKEAGLKVEIHGAKYGGHANTQDGMPNYKEWKISIPFTNNKGKAVALVGQITASGAGTVQDPMSRYDITAYVTPVAQKIQENSDICSTCDGSGEGMADGTSCSSCGGSGRDDDGGDGKYRKSRSGKEDDFDHGDTDAYRDWAGMDEGNDKRDS
jgi:hypothetical protein